jgi:hypothetical protein
MTIEETRPRARPSLRRAALILAAVAAVLAAARFARRRAPAASRRGEVHFETLRRASPAERALFAPLTEGGELDGCRIRMIASMGQGRVGLVVSDGTELINVWVMPDAPGAPRALHRSARYLVYYTAPSRLQPTAMRLTNALAAVVRRNEGRFAPAGDAGP